MPGQHNNATKEHRSQGAIAVADEMNAAYRRSLLGSRQQVLFEEISDGYYTGHAPNSIRVYAEGEDLHNEIRTVRITDLFRDGVVGVIE